MPNGRKTTRICCVLPGTGRLAALSQETLRFYTDLQDLFSKKGVGTVVLNRTPTTGDPVEQQHRIPLEYSSAFTAFLRSIPRMLDQPTKVVLIGHSLGGHVAPCLAIESDQVLGYVLVNAHNSCLSDVLAKQLKRRYPNLTKANHWYNLLFREYLESSDLFSPNPYLEREHRPVLCVNGGKDTNVDPLENNSFRLSLRTNSAARFNIYPESDHLMRERSASGNKGLVTSPRFLADLSGWIDDLNFGS